MNIQNEMARLDGYYNDYLYYSGLTSSIDSVKFIDSRTAAFNWNSLYNGGYTFVSSNPEIKYVRSSSAEERDAAMAFALNKHKDLILLAMREYTFLKAHEAKDEILDMAGEAIRMAEEYRQDMLADAGRADNE